MADKDRFGKSSRSYAVDTPRERGIKEYHRNLSKGLGSGRNVQRIREARRDYKLNRPPRWDEKAGDVIRDVGGDVKDMFFPAIQKAGKFIGSLGANWQRDQQNKKILSDDYDDEIPF